MSYITEKFDDEVTRLLIGGGVGLLPTDTIYGLSCRALDEPAVERIRALKGRDDNRPLIVLISDIRMLNMLSIDPSQADIIMSYWPGSISLEFQTPAAPIWLHRGLRHFAIRMPDYPELAALITKTGPLVSTSANRQGQPPVRSVPEAKEVFRDKLDFYVDIGELDNPPSTLAVVKDGRLQAVREGAVKIEERSGQ